jgi:hypothetical protein
VIDVFKFSLEDVTATFDLKVNLNSGLKRAIKDSGSSHEDRDDYLAFAKSFRDVVARNRKSERDEFIVRYLGQAPNFFARVATMIFRDQVQGVARGIVDRYAEEFNNTYRENEESSLEVLDGSSFERIVAEAYSEAGRGLMATGLPDNNFLRVVILSMVFTEGVNKEIRKRVST